MKIISTLLVTFASLGNIIAQPYCDQPQGTTGFPSDLNCQTAVCNLDAFCCENTWDSFCASAALITPECSECLSGQTLYCNSVFLNPGFPTDAFCETAVCAIDNFCCTDVWDASCASLAQITGECTGCLSPVENDNCVSAIELSISPSCNATAGTLNEATRSGYDPICDPFAVPNDDVFYVFTAPSNGLITVSVQPEGTYPLTVEVLQPSNLNNICQGFWQVACIFGNSSGQLMTTDLTGLSSGSSYYIRVYTESNEPAADGDFTICLIGEVPPCNISIDPSAIPETEECGLTLNDGCEMILPEYETMPCNGSVTGQCWSDGAGRDSDWYQFNISSNSTPVSLTGKAEFAFEIEIVNIADCNSPVVVASLSGGPCQSVTLTEELPTGQFAAVIRPQVLTSVSCQSNSRFYELGLTRPVAAQNITSTLGADTCTSCFNETTGEGDLCQMTVAPGGVSYQWFHNGNPLTGVTQQSTSDVAFSGNYTVAVTDENGCTTLSDNHLVQYSTPPIASSFVTRHICGMVDGIWTIFGDGPYPATAFVDIGGSSQDITVTGPQFNIVITEPGPVTLQGYTDANGCSRTVIDTDTVNEIQSGLSAMFTHIPGQGEQLFNSAPNQNVTHDWLLVNLSTGDTYTSTNADPTFIVDLGNDQWEMCHSVTSLDGNCAEEHCAMIGNGIGLIESQLQNFLVYPNPNDGTFFVKGSDEVLASVSILDLAGRFVFNESAFQGLNRFITTELPVGTYLLRVTTETGTQSSRLIHIALK